MSVLHTLCMYSTYVILLIVNSITAMVNSYKLRFIIINGNTKSKVNNFTVYY